MRHPRYHGMLGTAEHTTWSSMLSRCRNPNVRYYALYGGRGIRVCDQWQGEGGFVNFLADMGRKPSPIHTIDRIDVNGNYEPGNVRWATPREQGANKRCNRNLTVDGETLTLTEWSRRMGLAKGVIEVRLRFGWDVKLAVTSPSGSVNPRAPARPHGEAHTQSKLTRAVIDALKARRALTGESYRLLAIGTGASPQTVYKAMTGRTWKTVP